MSHPIRVLGLCSLALLGLALGNGLAALAATAEQGPGPSVLWYRQAAKSWGEALPIGNGRLGGMVFGGVAEEHVQLNDDTLWVGGPKDRCNPEALEALPEVRKLLFAGKNNEAAGLAGRTMMGVPPRIESYQTLGDLRLALAGADMANGQRSQFTYAATMDIQIIHDLCTNCIAAIKKTLRPPTPYTPRLTPYSPCPRSFHSSTFSFG
jgi:hypothetical protein